MKKAALLSLVVTVLLAVGVIAEAQQPGKSHRIAYVSGNLSAIAHRVDAFRDAMRGLGYIEGENIVIEWRSAADLGKRGRERYRKIMAELLRLKVEVIVTGGGGATRSAKKATSTIPIVMTQDRDPVANGFVASLARPGGNITGLSRRAPELSVKQLELLKEIVPKLSRVAVIKSTSRRILPVLEEIKLAAKQFAVELHYVDVASLKDVGPAFRDASDWHADAAMWLVPDPNYNSNRAQVTELAVKSRLPVMYFRQVDVEAGGLISYGVDFTELDRRAATYVDKILKGRRPADLPVERPWKFELHINLKAAKRIGLTIPQWTLMKANRVIK